MARPISEFSLPVETTLNGATIITGDESFINSLSVFEPRNIEIYVKTPAISTSAKKIIAVTGNNLFLVFFIFLFCDFCKSKS